MTSCYMWYMTLSMIWPWPMTHPSMYIFYQARGFPDYCVVSWSSCTKFKSMSCPHEWLNLTQYVHIWMNSFYTWHKWPLAFEGILQGYTALSLHYEQNSILVFKNMVHFIMSPLQHVQFWMIISIFGTNDHWHERVHVMTFVHAGLYQERRHSRII